MFKKTLKSFHSLFLYLSLFSKINNKKLNFIIHRRKQYEVESLEQSIRQRSEQQKKAGAELDATCNICLKTRFADGIGHVCHYCSIRCCARCGGKVTLRSNKVIFINKYS
jgi:hypothetical protein